MEPIIWMVVLLVVLDLAAWRWGVDSNDGFDSPEWDRRRHWRAFGGDDW